MKKFSRFFAAALMFMILVTGLVSSFGVSAATASYQCDLDVGNIKSGQFEFMAYDIANQMSYELESTSKATWSPDWPGHFVPGKEIYTVSKSEIPEAKLDLMCDPANNWGAAVVFTAPAAGKYNIVVNLNKYSGVDANGKVIDGDAILYILSKRLKSRGMLSSDTVVATIMSNSGLEASLAKLGIACKYTDVGDRFVYECMQKNDYSLGGEQSGHIILKKYAATGDGLLTAIMIAEELCDTKLSLAELTKGLTLYPQYTKNIKVSDKDAVLSDEKVLEKKADIEKLIDGNGRVLLRKSGTENVVRIMVEAENLSLCDEYAKKIAKVIAERGHSVE